ncbi:MAG: deoxyribose-phosphate aldolase [Bauldia sp.]
MPMKLDEIAAVIQHTDVSPTATESNIRALCADAVRFRFNGVMVQPCWIGLCRAELAGTDIKVCSAMAYPMGGGLTRSKVAEMRHLVEEGVDEIDFMPNLGFLLSGRTEEFRAEIVAVVEAAEGRPVKAMLELEPLSIAERRLAILEAEAGGCAYVKNSSGWGVGGKATAELIRFMAATATRAKVKASGGIRSRQDAEDNILAGAVLLGTSAGPAIMRSGVGANAY